MWFKQQVYYFAIGSLINPYSVLSHTMNLNLYKRSFFFEILFTIYCLFASFGYVLRTFYNCTYGAPYSSVLF
jgi:hypothetical protein